MEETKSESALRILILGGKQELIARISQSDFARNGNTSFYARKISEAMQILQSENEGINQIIIEAFMENDERETPFHFLKVLRQSPYADIPVLVVAGEPGRTGRQFLGCVQEATKMFGAQFVSVNRFDPDDADFAPKKLIEAHHERLRGRGPQVARH